MSSPPSVDVAVVGGGLAGLAAAYRLKRRQPGATMVVLEAETIGGGATGRSTGMVGPGVGDILTVRAKHGDDTARRMFQASLDGVSAAARIIRDEAIDCALEVPGQLYVARTARHATRLARRSAAFADLGFDVPYLGPSVVEGALGTDAYLAGMRYSQAALVDPLRLCRGLAGRLRGLGVDVREHTPVLAVDPGRPVRLATATGAIGADRVLLATDGFSSALGVLPRSLVPLEAHAIVTEPLPAAGRGQVAWPGREGVVEGRNFFHYYRLTADDRIVFGGGRPRLATERRPDDGSHARRVWDQLERELVEVFPALAGLTVTDRRAGRLGFTLDRLPVVGPLASMEGVWFSGAWCGHGLALSVGAGDVLADLMLDGRPAADVGLPWVRSTGPHLPGDPLRSAGLRGYLGILGLADRAALAAGSRRRRRGLACITAGQSRS